MENVYHRHFHSIWKFEPRSKILADQEDDNNEQGETFYDIRWMSINRIKRFEWGHNDYFRYAVRQMWPDFVESSLNHEYEM